MGMRKSIDERIPRKVTFGDDSIQGLQTLLKEILPELQMVLDMEDRAELRRDDPLPSQVC
jgi:hypothetical protein